MQKLYVHPLPVRIWHWINALGFVLLILSGMQIRYADAIHLMSLAILIRLTAMVFKAPLVSTAASCAAWASTGCSIEIMAPKPTERCFQRNDCTFVTRKPTRSRRCCRPPPACPRCASAA